MKAVFIAFLKQPWWVVVDTHTMSSIRSSTGRFSILPAAQPHKSTAQRSLRAGQDGSFFLKYHYSSQDSINSLMGFQSFSGKTITYGSGVHWLLGLRGVKQGANSDEMTRFGRVAQSVSKMADVKLVRDNYMPTILVSTSESGVDYGGVTVSNSLHSLLVPTQFIGIGVQAGYYWNTSAVIMHEIMHALGALHPHDLCLLRPCLPASDQGGHLFEDRRFSTVMSYNNNDGYELEAGALDGPFLRWLYGLPPEYIGDTVHKHRWDDVGLSFTDDDGHNSLSIQSLSERVYAKLGNMGHVSFDGRITSQFRLNPYSKLSGFSASEAAIGAVIVGAPGMHMTGSPVGDVIVAAAGVKIIPGGASKEEPDHIVLTQGDVIIIGHDPATTKLYAARPLNVTLVQSRMEAGTEIFQYLLESPSQGTRSGLTVVGKPLINTSIPQAPIVPIPSSATRLTGHEQASPVYQYFAGAVAQGELPRGWVTNGNHLDDYLADVSQLPIQAGAVNGVALGFLALRVLAWVSIVYGGFLLCSGARRYRASRRQQNNRPERVIELPPTTEQRNAAVGLS